jgi:hypothetical protein
LGFLETGLFPRESKEFSYWILLDFLGFSRPNLDLSMGYEDFRGENFSRALSPRHKTHWDGRRRSSHAAGRIVHGAILTRFLIFFKRLPFEPFPFGDPAKAFSG